MATSLRAVLLMHTAGGYAHGESRSLGLPSAVTQGSATIGAAGGCTPRVVAGEGVAGGVGTAHRAVRRARSQRLTAWMSVYTWISSPCALARVCAAISSVGGGVAIRYTPNYAIPVTGVCNFAGVTPGWPAGRVAEGGRM